MPKLRLSIGSEYFILPGLYPITKGIGYIILIPLNGKRIVVSKDKILARVVFIPYEIFPENVKNSYVMNVPHISNSVTEITIDDLNMDTDLDSRVKYYSHSLLLNILNSYRNCLAFSTAELGKTSVTEMRINLHDASPVTYRPHTKNSQMVVASCLRLRFLG